MSWSWKLGRIAAIDVYVHFTFFLLLGWEALRDYRPTATRSRRSAAWFSS